MSLEVWLHNAQIRASTCLALSSSGAAFSAPNRKSSPWARSLGARGRLAGGCGSAFGPVVSGGEICGPLRGGAWANAAVGT